MIEMDFSGIAAFNAQLTLELARLDREISQAFEGWTKRIFTGLVEKSPQYSGDMAANWRYSIGSPDYTYSEIPNKHVASAPFAIEKNPDSVHSRGHPEAVAMALAQLPGMHPTWRDTVYFANSAPPAEGLEAGYIAVRPINLVDGRVAMIQYAVDMETGGPIVVTGYDLFGPIKGR